MILVLNEYSLVMMAERSHPFPIPNTEVKLSSADGSWDLVPVRVGRCQAKWRISSAGRAPALQAGGSAVRSRHPPPYMSEGVAKWLNAADCKSAPSGSAVRICPPPPFLINGL